MITVKFIQKQNDWELAVAEGIRQFVRQSYGVSVIVDVEEDTPQVVKTLDPTPFVGRGYRFRDEYVVTKDTRWKNVFDPRPMFEQDRSKYRV